jgi:hypothetical protein
VVPREAWSDAVPRGVRARVAVQEQDRQARTAAADAQDDVTQIDVVEGESFEHALVPPIPPPARCVDTARRVDRR